MISSTKDLLSREQAVRDRYTRAVSNAVKQLVPDLARIVVDYITFSVEALEVGQTIEAKCKTAAAVDGEFFPALVRVMDLEKRRLMVHYVGWSAKWDEWLSFTHELRPERDPNRDDENHALQPQQRLRLTFSGPQQEHDNDAKRKPASNAQQSKAQPKLSRKAAAAERQRLAAAAGLPPPPRRKPAAEAEPWEEDDEMATAPDVFKPGRNRSRCVLL